MAVGAQAGSLFWRITVDNRRFRGALSAARKSAMALGDTVTAVARQVRFAFIGMAAGFGLAVKQAADAEEAASKFGFVFKDQAEDAGAALDEFAKRSNRSRYELRAMAGDLQALIGPMGGTIEESSRMSVEMAKLATDLSSFFNVSESDALTALRAGIVGEAEPLRRLGVQINAVKVEQEALAQGWIKSKDDLTPLIRTQAIYNIVMRETAQAQGDAERTAGSFTNQMRGLWAAIKDLSIDAASPFLGVLGDLIGMLREMLPSSERAREASERFAAAFDEARPTIRAFFDTAKSVVLGTIDIFRTGFGYISEVVLRLWNWLTGSTSSTFQTVTEQVQDALDLIAFGFDNWEDIVSIAVLGVLKTVTDWRDYFVNILKYIGEVIGTFAVNMFFRFQNAFDNVMTLFRNFGDNVQRFFAALWEAIKTQSTDPLRDLFEDGFVGLTDGFKKAVGDIPVGEFVNESSPFAKQLQSEIDALNEDLGQRLFDFQSQREQARKDAELAASEQVAGPNLPSTDMSTPQQAKEAEKPSFVGVAEAWSKIQQQVFGTGKEGKRDRIAENQLRKIQDVAANTKSGTDALNRIYDFMTGGGLGLGA